MVGTDFTPYYSGGHWAMTDYGWTWVSDYNWGWAPFHYGRWQPLGAHGWCWIPGRIWGPAWVHWRLGGGYVGWAPLPPRGVRIAPPFYGGGLRPPAWNFVPMGQLTSPHLMRIAPTLAAGLYARTAVATDLRSIGSTRIVYGPPLNHFAAASIAITPTPLRTLQLAMPRSNIVVRPGVPLTSRRYFAPAYRQAVSLGRPLAAPPGAHIGYPQGGYGHPGYFQPGYSRPVTINPAPGYARPGYSPPAPVQRAPMYSHPNYQAPVNPRPAFQPPAYERPAFQRPPAPPPPPVHTAPAPSRPAAPAHTSAPAAAVHHH
jgi:hypothetical protein